MWGKLHLLPEVKILETMENWSKVKTADGYIGYVENKRLVESTILLGSAK